MKKLVVFSEDDHTAMLSLVKDSINEVERMEEAHPIYALYLVHDKLNEVFSILTEEGEK